MKGNLFSCSDNADKIRQVMKPGHVKPGECCIVAEYSLRGDMNKSLWHR